MATSLGGWFDKVFFDAHGEPCASGELRFYQTGTDIPQGVATFDGTPLGAVIRLDDDGRPESDFRFYTDKIYRVVVVDADGVVVKTIDGVAIPESEGGGMYNPMTAAGDVIVGGTDGAAERLAAGNDGDALKIVSGVPAWAPDADEKVKVSATDASSGYLDDKLAVEQAPSGLLHKLIYTDVDGNKSVAFGIDAAGSTNGQVITSRMGFPKWETIPTQTGDHKVSADGTDTAGYLEDKLDAGSGISLTTSAGKVVVSADTQPGDHKIKVNATDSEADYLRAKVHGGTLVNVNTETDGSGYANIRIDLAASGASAGDVPIADGVGGAVFGPIPTQPGDHKTAVDGADASPDYLAAKLAAGTGISLTNTGSAVEIAATTQTGDHQLLVSATDAAAGYLGAKLTAGSNVTLTTQTDGDGVQSIEISATGGGGGGADWGYAPYGQPLVHSYFAFNTSYGTRLFGGCLPQTIKSFTLYPRVSFNTAFGAYGWFFVALYDSSTNALITPFTWANHSGFPDKDVAKPITLSYDSSATIDRNKDYFVRISFRYISANPGSRFCSATAYFDTNYSTQGLCGTYTRSGTLDGNAPSSAMAYTWDSAIQSFPWFSLNTFPGEA